MPDGALEIVNEAAFEAAGEPVCEGSDPVEINSDAVKEILPMTDSAPVAPLRLRPRDRDAIVSSLRAGVVPQRGFAHIQVGRANEIAAFAHDLDRVADGGSMVRFVIGDYGAGKTFFLHLAASIAAGEETRHRHGRPHPGPAAAVDRRPGPRPVRRADAATSPPAPHPDGGALPSVVERFVATAQSVARSGGVSVGSVIAEQAAATCPR